MIAEQNQQAVGGSFCGSLGMSKSLDKIACTLVFLNSQPNQQFMEVAFVFPADVYTLILY
jgi:hypothetical protein